MKYKYSVVVTGGAGYIGAHTVEELRKRGDCKIFVIDNFSQSRNNIIDDESITYHEIDIRDNQKMSAFFVSEKPDVVFHFAALASVPDSVINPSEYYENNLVGGINLLEAMRAGGTKKIIFSSSASVYGEPQSEEIKEDHQKVPANPYGYTKLVFEQVLKDYLRAYDISSISLRYFCASGCNISAGLGEYHTPETHVIPSMVLTLLGKRDSFSVFGDDFSTQDGTGVRDYIHVCDLATAHIKSFEKLLSEDKFAEAYNLGINKGFSVLELIKITENVSGKKLNYKIVARREGDPSKLIANSSKAQKELGWTPQYIDPKQMVESSYLFFKKLNQQ